jgi:hypothetical protein
MLDKLKAYAAQALCAFLAVALLVAGWRLHRALLDAEQTRTTLRAEREDRQSEATERALVALEDARATFRRNEIHARNQQEIADAQTKQDRARAAALAAATADGERMRHQIRDFAAACGGGETATIAAAIADCRHRAAALGQLYEEADRQAEEFAGAAEQHADEIRTLKRVVQNDRALSAP